MAGRSTEEAVDFSLGFVDLQVNGYGGISFTDPCLSREQCAEACRQILRRGGTAAFLPTVCSAPMPGTAAVTPLK